MINEQNSRAKNSTWWRRRTRIEKHLLIAVLLLAILFIIASYLALMPAGREEPAMCLTPSCVRTASQILSHVDLDADPCVDFYNFTCGKFMRNTFLPDYRSSITAFSTVADLVDEQMRTVLAAPANDADPTPFALSKAYYRACMDAAGRSHAATLGDVRRVLRAAGGWPALEGVRWDDSLFDWKTALYRFRRLGLKYDMFFSFDVLTDLKNSSRNLLTLDQPYVPFEKLMLKGLSERIVQAYLDYIIKVVKLLGGDERRAAVDIRSVIELDIALAKILVPQEDRRNSSLEYNPMTIRELEQEFPYVPWLQLINVITLPVKKMTYDDTVIVAVPAYFQKFGDIIKNTPNRILANFMFWSAFRDLIDYLSDDVRNLKLEFSKIASGKSEREPRWKECSVEVTNLQAASGSLYVKKFFNQQAKAKMVEMVGNIRASMVETLANIDWMDDETRMQAIEKADAIHVHMAYPDELFDDKKIADYYRTLQISADNYLASYLNISLFEYEKSYAELDRAFNKSDWRRHAYATVTNAFYEQSENSIEFPAGILQGVFFDNQRPNYLNYGAISYIIGHEITHGFDDEGRQYDKDGNLRQWWKARTEDAFNEKAQCIVDQYSNFTVPQINLNINGINTQGENIADNGGIKQAYSAYKKWSQKNGPEPPLPGLPFTPEQMFWISAGNTWCSVQRAEQLKMDILSGMHSPAYYRVNVPLMNNEDFARDFNCPIGSAMNPRKKCVVW